MAAPRRTADSRSRLGNHLVCFRDLLYGAPAPRITLDSADRNSHALREERATSRRIARVTNAVVDGNFFDIEGVDSVKTPHVKAVQIGI